MGGDKASSFLYAAICAILLASSLIAMRLPIKQYLKMIFAWVAIFAVAFAIFSFRPEMNAIWHRITGELTGAPRQAAEGDNIILTRQDDGHFWVRTKVNGKQADFMVDTGATTTAINRKTALKLGIEIEQNSLVDVDTANGIVRAKQGKIAVMKIESKQIKNHLVIVSENFGETNVVGMNFLDQFASWTVRDDKMVLEP